MTLWQVTAVADWTDGQSAWSEWIDPHGVTGPEGSDWHPDGSTVGERHVLIIDDVDDLDALMDRWSGLVIDGRVVREDSPWQDPRTGHWVTATCYVKTLPIAARPRSVVDDAGRPDWMADRDPVTRVS
jgi:hypothetical protein